MNGVEEQEALLKTEIVDTEEISTFKQNFKFKEGYEFKKVGTAGRYDNYDKSAAESLGKIVIQMTKIQDIEKQIETEALERAQTEYKKADLARTKYEALEKAQKEYKEAQSKYEEALMQEQAQYQALEQAQEALGQAQYQAYQASGQDQNEALKQAQDKAQEEYEEAQTKYQEALEQKRAQYEALEQDQDEALEQDQEEYEEAQYRVQNEALRELKQAQNEAQEEYRQAQEEYKQAQEEYEQAQTNIQEVSEAQTNIQEVLEAQYQLKHQADKALIKVNQAQENYEALSEQTQELKQVEVLKLAQAKYKIASEQAQAKYKEAFEALQEESETTLEEAQTNIQKAIQKFYTDKDTSLTMDGNTDVFFHNAKYYTGDEPQKFQTILTNAFKNMQLMKSEDPLLQKIGQSYTKPSKQKELFEKQMKTQIEEQTKKANRETINNLLDIAELKANESGGYSGYQSNFKAVRDSNVKEDAGIQNRLGGNYDKDALRVVDLTLINDSQKKLSQDTFNQIMELKGPGFADTLIYTASYRNNTNIDSLKQFQEYFIQYEKSKTNEDSIVDSVTDSKLYEYAKYKKKFEILLLENTLTALEERLDKQEQELYPEVATIKEDLGLDKSCTVIEAMNLAVLQYEAERQEYAKKQLSEPYSQKIEQLKQRYSQGIEQLKQQGHSEQLEGLDQQYSKQLEELKEAYLTAFANCSQDFDNNNLTAFNQYKKNKLYIEKYLETKAKRSLENANPEDNELTAQVEIERKKLDKNLVEQISKMSKTTSMSNDEFYKLTEQMKTNISDDVKLLRTLDEALLTKITGNTNFVNNNRDLYYYGNDSIGHNLDASKIVMYEFLSSQTTDESLKNEYDEKAKNILETVLKSIKGKNQDKFLKIVSREASRMNNITPEQQTNFNTQMEAFFKDNLTNGIENKIYTSTQTKKNTKEIKSLTKEIETETKKVYFDKKNEKLFEQVGVKTKVMFSKKKPTNIKKDLDEKYANCSLKEEFYSEILKLKTSLPARFNAERSEIQKLLAKMKENAKSKEQKAAFNIFEKEIKSMGSIARDKVGDLQKSNNVIITAINNINNQVTSATKEQQTRKDRLEGKANVFSYKDDVNFELLKNNGKISAYQKQSNGFFTVTLTDPKLIQENNEIEATIANKLDFMDLGPKFTLIVSDSKGNLIHPISPEEISNSSDSISLLTERLMNIFILKEALGENFNALEYKTNPSYMSDNYKSIDNCLLNSDAVGTINQRLNALAEDSSNIEFKEAIRQQQAMLRQRQEAMLRQRQEAMLQQRQPEMNVPYQHQCVCLPSDLHDLQNNNHIRLLSEAQQGLAQVDSQLGFARSQPSQYDHRGSTKSRYILSNQKIRNDEYDIDDNHSERDSFDNEQNDTNKKHNINHSLSSMSSFSNSFSSKQNTSFLNQENLRSQAKSDMGVRGFK